MELSKRLETVASLVTKGAFVADIGTDHGFVPIWLMQQGVIRHAIAMDVNQGPLERARLHISSYNLSSKIETRLSDGMCELAPGEADTVIIAGMGGPLIQRILTEHPSVTAKVKEFILQPQSEIPQFRSFLQANHFKIAEERCIYEDGKFYFAFRAEHGEEQKFSQAELEYGRKLLENRDPVLNMYLLRDISLKKDIISKLEMVHSDNTIRRIQVLKEELGLAELTLRQYFN